MAYNLHLSDRISQVLKSRKVAFTEKMMMGGLCYMIDDKMCMGIIDDSFMARVHPDQYPELLSRKGAREMDFTGRPMKGYLFVGPEGIDLDKDLEYWIKACLDFNPLAKSSKKKG